MSGARTGSSSSSRSGWSRQLTVVHGGAAHNQQPVDRTSPVIDVLLAEPVGLVRAGLRTLLEGESDIRVAGEAMTADQAVAGAAELRPDIVLIDLRLAGGLAAARRIITAGGTDHVRVLMLTPSESEEDLFGALQAGASGFMPLDTDPVDLVRAVRVVAGGGAQLSPFATARLLDEVTAGADSPSEYAEDFEDLTIRERDIVVLAAMGLTNREIAERLVISPATVKTHVSRAMRKLHTDTRAKLVALAHQSGFVRYHRAVDLRASAEPPVVHGPSHAG
ncbi:MAG TPA: response regulator transcription factor [Thermoleophilaceae bacterium]|jgi:DNA-binding NarL/FixJ family response regulator|nr:response regulator transcription factor [Thermoleophilaceae bacterium]